MMKVFVISLYSIYPFFSDKLHNIILYFISICTCTVCGSRDWHIRFDKFIDMIISRTGFDLDGIGYVVITQIGIPYYGSQHVTCNHSVLKSWMRTIEIKSSITSTSSVTCAPLRHSSILSIQKQPIPPIPFNKPVIIAIIAKLGPVYVSPKVINDVIIRARIRDGCNCF